MGEMSQFADLPEVMVPADKHGVEAYISADYARAERYKLHRNFARYMGTGAPVPLKPES